MFREICLGFTIHCYNFNRVPNCNFSCELLTKTITIRFFLELSYWSGIYISLTKGLFHFQANGLFHYESCKFHIRRCKESTGRVVMYRAYDIKNSFTMEATFCGTQLDK